MCTVYGMFNDIRGWVCEVELLYCLVDGDCLWIHKPEPADGWQFTEDTWCFEVHVRGDNYTIISRHVMLLWTKTNRLLVLYYLFQSLAQALVNRTEKQVPLDLKSVKLVVWSGLFHLRHVHDITVIIYFIHSECRETIQHSSLDIAVYFHCVLRSLHLHLSMCFKLYYVVIAVSCVSDKWRNVIGMTRRCL